MIQKIKAYPCYANNFTHDFKEGAEILDVRFRQGHALLYVLEPYDEVTPVKTRTFSVHATNSVVPPLLKIHKRVYVGTYHVDEYHSSYHVFEIVQL